MQNGGQGLDVLAKDGFTVFLLFWFLMIVCSPTSTEIPISKELGPSALEIATGFSAYAVDSANMDTKTTLNIDFI